jgi:MFS family permease
MTSENPVGLSEKKSETSAVEDTGFDAPEAHHYSSEEKHLLRKIDWTLIPWVGFLYFLAVEDRVNVGFALTMNHEVGHDLNTILNMTGPQGNIGVGLFYAAYILFEVPSNLIMTRVRPSLWLARIMITWGIVTSFFTLVKAQWSFYLLRFLLGALEAGFWPGLAYYMTLWYRKTEQASRIGWYFTASPLSGAVGGLISAGVQLMDGDGHLYGFQWLFLFSGVITFIFGVATIWYLPDTPHRPHRRFTSEELELAKNRLADEKEAVHWSWGDLIAQAKDYKVWLFTLMYLTPVMAVASLAFFVPKIVQQMGYSSLNVSLLSVPVFVFGTISVVLISRSSDYFKERGWHIIGCAITSFVGFVILSFAPSVGARYFGLLVAAAGTYGAVPPVIAWITNNKDGDVAVASAVAIVSSVANFGALVTTFALYSAWTSDAPKYIGSNMINGGAMLLTGIAAAWCKYTYSKKNRIIRETGMDPETGRKFLYII